MPTRASPAEKPIAPVSFAAHTFGISARGCATCDAPTVSLAGPQNLTASVAGTTVTLSWGAATVTSYVVEAGSAPGLRDLAAVDIGNPSGNPVAVAFTNVQTGTYYVRVRSYLSGVGLTQPSNEALVIVGAACAAPAPPSTLSGTVTGSTVLLTWTASGGCSPDHYVVQAGSAPGLSDLANVSTAAPSFSATGIASGVYYVRVRAATGVFVSGPSNEIVLAVGAACASPLPPSALAADVRGSSVSLTWNAPASACQPTSYIVQAGSAPGLSDLANVSTGSAVVFFAAAGVANGTYYVRVRAAYGGTVSDPSNEVIVHVNSVAGLWDGQFQIADCTNITPDGLNPLNLCGMFPATNDYRLALSQNGNAVTGRYVIRTPLAPCACGGNYGTIDVAGTAALDGTVDLTGSGVLFGQGLSETITFRLSLPTTVSLAGTVTADVSFGGFVRARFSGPIVSGTRQ